MTHSKAAANSQALRLSPPNFESPLAAAIWLVTIATGRAPTDEDVRAYLAQAQPQPQPQPLPTIRPREWYEVDGQVIHLRHVTRRETGGRAQWRATLDGDRRPTLTDRSLSRLVRAVEERWPGGTWHADLDEQDRQEVLAAWGLA